MNVQKDLISVVIPTYNRAPVILSCLKSVLGQTYRNLEVVVVDDGSDDGTEKLFLDYPDSRVRFFRCTENLGACRARNYGAERAVGEYIAFQDSDDIWMPEKLEKELRLLKAREAELVFCGMERAPEGGKSYYFPVHGYKGVDPVSEFLMENRAGTQTMLMRREVWETLRFDESFRRYQDWDFAIRAAESFRLAYLPEALVYSPVSGSSISASVSSCPALERLFEKHRAEFESRPECLRTYYRRMAKRLRRSEPRMAAEYCRAALRLGGNGLDLLALLGCLSAKNNKESGRSAA